MSSKASPAQSAKPTQTAPSQAKPPPTQDPQPQKSTPEQSASQSTSQPQTGKPSPQQSTNQSNSQPQTAKPTPDQNDGQTPESKAPKAPLPQSQPVPPPNSSAAQGSGNTQGHPSNQGAPPQNVPQSTGATSDPQTMSEVARGKQREEDPTTSTNPNKATPQQAANMLGNAPTANPKDQESDHFPMQGVNTTSSPMNHPMYGGYDSTATGGNAAASSSKTPATGALPPPNGITIADPEAQKPAPKSWFGRTFGTPEVPQPQPTALGTPEQILQRAQNENGGKMTDAEKEAVAQYRQAQTTGQQAQTIGVRKKTLALASLVGAGTLGTGAGTIYSNVHRNNQQAAAAPSSSAVNLAPTYGSSSSAMPTFPAPTSTRAGGYVGARGASLQPTATSNPYPSGSGLSDAELADLARGRLPSKTYEDSPSYITVPPSY